MTELPTPKQWVLRKLNEMEMAEMIEKYIDFYREDEDGNRHSVQYPMKFVRHFMRRNDGVLPVTTAVTTLPIVLADGHLLAPEGLDRLRGIHFKIQPEVRAIIPRPEDCTPERVQKAMRFLRDEWLVDVATDGTGKAMIVACALTLIERSLLPQRPIFIITAGRRGSGKTTTIKMLISGVTGIMPAAAAWSSNVEERRKALLSYFIYGCAYILWDNIPRGTQIACPYIELSCTSSLYDDRKLGVSEMVRTSASTIHIFTGNNIAARGDLASRSLNIRLEATRADPENRPFKHPSPVNWTQKHRAEIVNAFYTILLGNPQLKAAPDAEGKTRFKMWWRLVGSAVENASKLAGHGIDFRELFLSQEDDDEESTSLFDALDILERRYRAKSATERTEFAAADIAGMINTPSPTDEEQTLRDFLYPGAPPNHVFSAKSIGRLLKKHLDEPVKQGERTLVLRKHQDLHTKALRYYVHRS